MPGNAEEGHMGESGAQQEDGGDWQGEGSHAGAGVDDKAGGPNAKDLP